MRGIRNETRASMVAHTQRATGRADVGLPSAIDPSLSKLQTRRLSIGATQSSTDMLWLRDDNDATCGCGLAE